MKASYGTCLATKFDAEGRAQTGAQCPKNGTDKTNFGQLSTDKTVTDALEISENRLTYNNLQKQDINLAKVGVEGSNPFARSKIPQGNQQVAPDLRNQHRPTNLKWGTIWGTLVSRKG